MNIVSMVLPKFDNYGRDLSDVHLALKSAAIANFGGFTAISGEGGWHDEQCKRDYVEPVIIYQFAVGKLTTKLSMESFARFYGHMAGQKAVMVTHADGSVAFLECYATVGA